MTDQKSASAPPQHPVQPSPLQGQPPGPDPSLMHGAIGIAAVAASAQQIKPKEVKRESHPLPHCLRDQD